MLFPKEVKLSLVFCAILLAKATFATLQQLQTGFELLDLNDEIEPVSRMKLPDVLRRSFQNVLVLEPAKRRLLLLAPPVIASHKQLMNISMLSCGTNLYPTDAVIFSLYDTKEKLGYLPFTTKWKHIRYKHKGISMGALFDPETKEFIATASGLFAFNWEGEKASDFAPAQIRIMKNNQELLGKGVMRKGERGTMRIFTHVWLMEGDRISTSYRGTISSGRRVEDPDEEYSKPVTVPTNKQKQKAKRKKNYEHRDFRHPTLLRFSGQLLIASPTFVQAPHDSDLCAAPGKSFSIQPSASKTRKMKPNVSSRNISAVVHLPPTISAQQQQLLGPKQQQQQQQQQRFLDLKQSLLL